MKKKRLKYGMFTDGEFAFLLDKIKRGVLVTEKERIEIDGMDIKFKTLSINGKALIYKNEEIDKNVEQKIKITKAIKEADDFAIEYYGGGYDDDCGNGPCILITYKLTREPYKTYIERIKTIGKRVLAIEKVRLKRVSKLEARKVLVEKQKNKKPKSATFVATLQRHRVQFNRFRQV